MQRVLCLALASSLALVSSATPASACVMPPPTRVRSVLPLDGAAGVPTNARPRVTYATGPGADQLCGARPAQPVLRVASADGGTPGDGGAASIPGNWVLATDDDPRNGTVWEFRPMAPLLPRTTYELLDTSAESCDCQLFPPCPPGALAVFARFTTGDGPDLTPPTFSGLLEGFCVRAVCAANDINCCGPYDHISLRLMPAADASDDFLVGVHFYVRKDGAPWDFSHAVGPGEINSPVDSLSTIRWDVPLSDGKWFVIARAFDLAGNEDGNLREAAFTMPLKNEPLCARAFIDGGVRYPDLMFPGLPDGTSMFPLDTNDDFSVSGGACNCAIGRSAKRGAAGSGAALGLGSAAALLGLMLRRRARRAR